MTGRRDQPALPAVGTIVQSKAGRDAGLYFVVVGTADEGHVWLSDGDRHKLCRPKKKKARHLRTQPHRLEGVQELLSHNGLQDAAIRRQLKALGYWGQRTPDGT